MNLYIPSYFATEEAVDIELVARADDTVATDAACAASCVSTLDDAEENIKAVLGDKKTDEEEAASDYAEGNIKAVLGDKKSDAVESSAPDVTYAAVAVSSGKSAVSVASMAIAGPDILSVQKKRGECVGIFCMSSYML
jgi:hypothetical protein